MLASFKKKLNFKKNWASYCLILITIIAAFLRLYRIDVLMRFIWDEGRDMLAIRQIIVNRDLTLFGPFNEIDNQRDFFGVFHYYLLLPSLWLANFDPLGPAIFTAILGIVTIPLSYYWLRSWRDARSSLLICSLLALSPLVVRYQQWPWNPNTTPFFTILYLIAFQKWDQKKHWFCLAVAGFLLGLLFQLHYFTIALSAAAALLIFNQQKNKLSNFFLFTFMFILPNLTFVFFDLTHEGFYRRVILMAFFGQNNHDFFVFQPINFIVGPIKYLFDLFSSFFASKILAFFLTIIFIYQLAIAIKLIVQKKLINEFSQLALTWCIFLLIVSFFPSIKNDYHSAGLWITLAIVTVDSAELLNKYLIKLVKNKFSIAKITIYFWLIFFIYLFWANQFWRQPDWSANLPRLKKIAAAIATNAEQQDRINIASFVDSDTRATRFRYLVISQGQNLLAIDQYPQSQILYAISPYSWEETISNPAWELASFRQLPADLIWTDGQWYVWRVEKT